MKPAQTILLVDDNVVNLKLLVGVLRLARFDPRPATSGQAALRALECLSPDAIILDVRMPGMSGLQLCRELRKIPAFKHTFVLFLTAELDPQTARDCAAAGGDATLEKPIEELKLLSKLREGIAQSTGTG